jgi:hypothetical protein
MQQLLLSALTALPIEVIHLMQMERLVERLNPIFHTPTPQQ